MTIPKFSWDDILEFATELQNDPEKLKELEKQFGMVIPDESSGSSNNESFKEFEKELKDYFDHGMKSPFEDKK